MTDRGMGDDSFVASDTTRWDTRRTAKAERMQAGSAYSTGKVVDPAKLADLLQDVIRPGDRVALEGDNQKQADFLSRTLADCDPKRLNKLHMLISSVSRSRWPKPQPWYADDSVTLKMDQLVSFNAAATSARYSVVARPSPRPPIKRTLLGWAAGVSDVNSNAVRASVWTTLLATHDDHQRLCPRPPLQSGVECPPRAARVP